MDEARRKKIEQASWNGIVGPGSHAITDGKCPNCKSEELTIKVSQIETVRITSEGARTISVIQAAYVHCNGCGRNWGEYAPELLIK